MMLSCINCKNTEKKFVQAEKNRYGREFRRRLGECCSLALNPNEL